MAARSTVSGNRQERTRASHLSGTAAPKKQSRLSGLSDEVLANSRVLIVGSSRSRNPQLRDVVGRCRSLNCEVIAVGDSPIAAGPETGLSGAETRSAFEWLDSEAEIAALKAAFDLGRRWFDLPEIDEHLTWNGTRLGEMVEHTLPPFALTRAIRLVEGAFRWLKQERPELIVLTDARSEVAIAFRQVAEKQGVPLYLASIDGAAGRIVDLLDAARLRLRWGLLDLYEDLARVLLPKLADAWLRLWRGKQAIGMPLAMFVGFAGNHYKHLLPVAEQLRQSSWRVSFLRGLEGKVLYASQGIDSGEIKLGTPDGYASWAIWRRCRRAKRRIRRVWRQLEDNGVLEQRFRYQGIGIWPLVRSALEYCFYVYLSTAVRYIEVTKKIIEEEAPNVIVFGNESGPRGHAMIAVARQQGIPTLEVQHGVAAEPGVYVSYADRMIVWGDHSRQALTEWGAASEKLIPLGAPGLDDLMMLATNEELLAERRLKAARQLGIEPTTNLVLVLTGYPVDAQQLSLIRMAYQSAKDLSLEGRLVVKPHPRETGNLHEKVALEMDFRPTIAKDVDLWGAIASSQAVIATLNTTAGLEALILRKPVIAVRTGEFNSIYAGATGLVHQVETAQELKSHLQDVLNGGGSVNGEALEWFVGPLDGLASKRAADFIVAFNKVT